MKRNIFEKVKNNRILENVRTLAAVERERERERERESLYLTCNLFSHLHTQCCHSVNVCAAFCCVANLKMNRFFRGSTTRLLFWQGDAGLSFSAFNWHRRK